MIGLAVSVLIATSPVPVMDVLQVYGRLAGPECFGKTVPAAAGASCQLTAERIRETVGDVKEAEFEARISNLPSFHVCQELEHGGFRTKVEDIAKMRR